jgi:hypothetical protein
MEGNLMNIGNVGDVIKCFRAGANTALTAGGGGDNTLVTGLIIDRDAGGWPESAVVAVSFTATLAASATLSLTTVVQEGQAANLSDVTTLQSQAATVVATGPVGGGTVTGCHEINVDLRGAGRYVRVNVTPDLSAGAADTATIAALLITGPGRTIPI